MADLAITATAVKPVLVWQQLTGPTDETVNAGQMVRIDTTTGKFTKANGTAAGEARPIGIAITTAGFAGQTITVVKQGLVDVGHALTAEAFDLPLYLSDTDGAIENSNAPTVDVIIGRVVAAWGATAADKLLLVDL
jgi:hypothetical protein